jgi:hypothetical protein
MEDPGKKELSARQRREEVMAQARDAGELESKLRAMGQLLFGHKGQEFFHRAWSPKAKQAKRAKRKAARKSRRRNRGR